MAPTTPPVDVQQPVENPELCSALQQFVTSRDARAEQELAHQLRRAVFLVPMLADELRVADGAEPGSKVLEPGSRVKLISCVDGAGAQHLPLFTDWAAIRAWTEQQVSTFVVPAADAWDMVLGTEQYAGAVVNPGAGEHALPLTKQTIAYLRGDTELEGADDVEDAIDALAEDPNEQKRVDLYVALQSSMLYLGTAQVPEAWKNGGTQQLDEATPIQMLTSSTKDGGTVLLAFTSLEEVQRSAPGTHVFAMRAVEVLRLVASGAYAGLVLNPGGRWVLVPKLDAEVIASDAASRDQA